MSSKNKSKENESKTSLIIKNLIQTYGYVYDFV